MKFLINFGNYLSSNLFSLVLAIIEAFLLGLLFYNNKKYLRNILIKIVPKIQLLEIILNNKSKEYLNRFKALFNLSQSLNRQGKWLIYRFKKRTNPTIYLSHLQQSKFPAIERSFTFLPRKIKGKILCIIFIFALLFITDTYIKSMLSKWAINIDGIGSLGSLGGIAWTVLATIISVGLATIGIILQTISQEKDEYKRKLLLHHFFHEQELDNKIFLSFSTLLISGALLLFKEKLFIYPWVSEHIYSIFLLIFLLILMYFFLIKNSFNYLFPENQAKYFRDILKIRLPSLIRKSALSLSIIERLENIIIPLGIGINYIYDEDDKKLQSIKIIETKEPGRIEDIDLSLLKEISGLMSQDKFVAEKDGKPLKAQIYIEYGRPEKREYQPIARVHIQNYSKKIEELFKEAIILSREDPPPLEDDLKEFHAWIWSNAKNDMQEGNVSLVDNFKFLYNFLEDALRIFSDYKKEFNLNEDSALNDWGVIKNDMRRQYFIFLEFVYSLSDPSIDLMFEVNAFPFGLAQISLKYKDKGVFVNTIQMIVWVYKKSYRFEDPRKNDLMNNFLLVNKELAEFYILSDRENFQGIVLKKENHI